MTQQQPLLGCRSWGCTRGAEGYVPAGASAGFPLPGTQGLLEAGLLLGAQPAGGHVPLPGPEPLPHLRTQG